MKTQHLPLLVPLRPADFRIEVATDYNQLISAPDTGLDEAQLFMKTVPGSDSSRPRPRHRGVARQQRDASAPPFPGNHNTHHSNTRSSFPSPNNDLRPRLPPSLRQLVT
eukprot:1882240-Pyramimonas_sp.AAC.1